MRLSAVSFLFCSLLAAQSGALVEVAVIDPAGAPIPRATVTLDLVSGGTPSSRLTSSTGLARWSGLAWQHYRLHASAPGFMATSASVSLRSNVPVRLTLSLPLLAFSQTLLVTESSSLPPVDPEQTGSRTLISRESIDQLARPGASRGIEQVLATFPGFAPNANGAIHPRGAHNQLTYIIDGMPVSDQLGGAFANSIDPALVETLELYTGNIPAEYGNKVSAVAQITTRSGQGLGRRFSGNLNTQAAQFDNLNQTLQLAGESGRLAWSTLLLGVKSNRYLDSVSLDNLHNGGNSQRFFTRLDYQASSRDILRLALMGGRSRFASANLRSQHANLMNQRQALDDSSLAATWLRTLDASSTIESHFSFRPSRARLLPSPGDTPVTAWQDRRAATLTLNSRYSKILHRHNLRFGLDYQTYPLTESFRFAVTHSGFEPELPTRAFSFHDSARGSMRSAFFQDQLRWGRFTATLGLRYDSYRFLVNGAQWQPRLGLAYHLRETNTVFRASYNRLYQTPPNENLLLSSSPTAARLAPPLVRETFGDAAPRLRPERQNFYEIGFQQGVRSWFTVSGAFYHKSATDQQDNNNFFNTGIIFPITLSRIRVNGAEGRIEIRPRRRWSANLSLTHARAVSTPPFTGGLYLGNEAVIALSAGPFLIDHDQVLGASGLLAYTHPKGFFANLTLRYDSGLVANPSDPAEVAADPDFADLLPYVNLTSHPARVRPRTLSDVVLGYRHKPADTTRWEFALQATNLTNQTALYSFQSIFTGTRVVQPRTLGLRYRFFF
ncbi:MAG: TonB-dependent receptor [Acidobacteriota bacterium]